MKNFDLKNIISIIPVEIIIIVDENYNYNYKYIKFYNIFIFIRVSNASRFYLSTM